MCHLKGDKLCRWYSDSVTRVNAELGSLGWRLVWVKGGQFGNSRHNYAHLAAALVLTQKDEVAYDTAKIQQEDLVLVHEQEQARACIFATSGLCIHLDSAVLACYLPYVGKVLDRQRCLDLAATLSVRYSGGHTARHHFQCPNRGQNVACCTWPWRWLSQQPGHLSTSPKRNHNGLHCAAARKPNFAPAPAPPCWSPMFWAPFTEWKVGLNSSSLNQNLHQHLRRGYPGHLPQASTWKLLATQHHLVPSFCFPISQWVHHKASVAKQQLEVVR